MSMTQKELELISFDSPMRCPLKVRILHNENMSVQGNT